jgi:NAD(P)H-quinone oxidoreductase subunit 5
MSLMHMLIPYVFLLLPGLPLVAGLWLASSRSTSNAARMALTGLGGAIAVSVGLAVVLALHGPWQGSVVPEWAPMLAVGLRLDGLSVVMSGLVAFLGFVIVRFAGTYLAGDAGQTRFLSWMCLTLAAVLTLGAAGTLGVLWLAWIATSVCLHRLLLYYPNRAAAIFAARKKFVVSRLGDACLLVAGLLLYRDYGSTELEVIFEAVAAGDTEQLPVIGGWLAACAVLKSAQFPFHSWLPDTMETPTPVSALMHAGIINAGGFLILRLSPLLVHAPIAMGGLVVIGSVTAAYGAVVMLAQPSVKRALAYSTIAQMGFMLLQCGLGAFGLALLHVVAHALYKAYAFLNAGSTVGAEPRAAVKLSTASLGLGLLVAVGIVAVGLLGWPGASPGAGVFAWLLALTLAYGLARFWSTAAGKRAAWLGVVIALAVGLVSFAGHGLAALALTFLPAYTSAPHWVVVAGAVFSGLFIFQAVLWRTGGSAFGRTLYVHALNGFYVGTFANRALGLLWPRSQS